MERALTFEECRATLLARVRERPPSRIQLLTGPRQVGKTTLLLELAERFGNGARYVACDGPEASLRGFWERTWEQAADDARDGPVLMLLDEAHELGDWAQRLKGEWDGIRRKRLPINIVASGSSALLLGEGSRERLTGRFEPVVLGHWNARSLARTFGIAPARAAKLIVERGGYPGAMQYLDDTARWTAYVRQAIVEPAIGRDVMALQQVRKPGLMRQLFAACTLAPAQIVSLQKLQGRLQDAGALETLSHYLGLLADSHLVAGLQKFSPRPLRRRSSPPKLVTLSNAFLAAADSRGWPDAAADPARYGAWVENAILAHAINGGQDVTYWRQEPLEVDAVIEGSWGRWALEVKTARFTTADLRGLIEFTARFPRYRPLVLGQGSAPEAAVRAGVTWQRWTDFLLDGPPT